VEVGFGPNLGWGGKNFKKKKIKKKPSSGPNSGDENHFSKPEKEKSETSLSVKQKKGA